MVDPDAGQDAPDQATDHPAIDRQDARDRTRNGTDFVHARNLARREGPKQSRRFVASLRTKVAAAAADDCDAPFARIHGSPLNAQREQCRTGSRAHAMPGRWPSAVDSIGLIV